MTKEERNKIYKNVLLYTKTRGWTHLGFCAYLQRASDSLQIEVEADPYSRMKRYFPEIYKRKPKKLHSMYWFPTYSKTDPKRESILKLAIKETNPIKTSKSNVTARSKKTVSKRGSLHKSTKGPGRAANVGRRATKAKKKTS